MCHPNRQGLFLRDDEVMVFLVYFAATRSVGGWVDCAIWGSRVTGGEGKSVEEEMVGRLT